jgi:hypothetical protein
MVYFGTQTPIFVIFFVCLEMENNYTFCDHLVYFVVKCLVLWHFGRYTYVVICRYIRILVCQEKSGNPDLVTMDGIFPFSILIESQYVLLS